MSTSSHSEVSSEQLLNQAYRRVPHGGETYHERMGGVGLCCGTLEWQYSKHCVLVFIVLDSYYEIAFDFIWCWEAATKLEMQRVKVRGGSGLLT